MNLTRLIGFFFTAIIIILAVIQICHGFYYLPKQVFMKRDAGTNRKTEQIDFLALKTATELLKQKDKLIICSDSHELANIASLSGISVLYDYDSLNKVLHTSKPLTLLVILSSSSLSYYRQFFLTYKPKLLLKYNMPNSSDKTANFYIVKFR